jgi:glucose/arabinose dehydrogenase
MTPSGRPADVVVVTPSPTADPSPPSASPPSLSGRTEIVGVRVIGDLNQPVSFDFDSRGRIWFVQKPIGEVQVFNPRNGDRYRFARISRLITDGANGLLGIALHPEFPAVPNVYVLATRLISGDATVQLLLLTADPGGPPQVDVIYSSPTNSQHSGGRLVFGPDGMLYVTIGDALDPSNAQDLSSTSGKILRLRPDGRAAPGNPFGSRVWAYGIRNSFGLAFDPRNGNLWETENGPECNDEMNRIRRGGNYGWGPSADCGSATAPLDTNRDGPQPILPLRWFTPPVSLTGVAFCEGCELGPRAEGAMFIGAYNTGGLYRATLSPDRAGIRSMVEVAAPGDLLLSLEVGPNDAIYYSTYLGIFRLKRVAA